MACVIWRETSRNGAAIGMTAAITAKVQNTTQFAQIQEVTACCAAARGSTIRTACGVRTAAATTRRMAPTISGSGVCGRRLSRLGGRRVVGFDLWDLGFGFWILAGGILRSLNH